MIAYSAQTMTPDQKPDQKPDQPKATADTPLRVTTTVRRDDRLTTAETVLLVSSLLTLAGVILFILLS